MVHPHRSYHLELFLLIFDFLVNLLHVQNHLAQVITLKHFIQGCDQSVSLIKVVGLGSS